jgi:hypothetical protein
MGERAHRSIYEPDSFIVSDERAVYGKFDHSRDLARQILRQTAWRFRTLRETRQRIRASRSHCQLHRKRESRLDHRPLWISNGSAGLVQTKQKSLEESPRGALLLPLGHSSYCRRHRLEILSAFTLFFFEGRGASEAMRFWLASGRSRSQRFDGIDSSGAAAGHFRPEIASVQAGLHRRYRNAGAHCPTSSKDFFYRTTEWDFLWLV